MTSKFKYSTKEGEVGTLEQKHLQKQHIKLNGEIITEKSFIHIGGGGKGVILLDTHPYNFTHAV